MTPRARMPMAQRVERGQLDAARRFTDKLVIPKGLRVVPMGRAQWSELIIRHAAVDWGRLSATLTSTNGDLGKLCASVVAALGRDVTELWQFRDGQIILKIDTGRFVVALIDEARQP